MAWPVEKKSELKLPIVFGSSSAAIFRFEITVCSFFLDVTIMGKHENSTSK